MESAAMESVAPASSSSPSSMDHAGKRTRRMSSAEGEDSAMAAPGQSEGGEQAEAGEAEERPGEFAVVCVLGLVTPLEILCVLCWCNAWKIAKSCIYFT